MADLTLRTAATLIERAIYSQISRSLRVRLPAVATVAALRAATTRGASSSGYARSDYDTVYCTAKGVCYEWLTSSTAADDGDAVVKPTDAGSTGRWLKTTSTVQSGYLVDVRLYEGEQTEEDLMVRLLGQRPSVVIRWENAEHIPVSQVAGSLYRYENNFDLWAVSSSMRGSALPEAVVGSPISAESAVDPGVNAIIGDLKRYLAGKTGDDLNQAGISYVEIGREEVVYRSYSERLFVYSLGLRVHSTVANPDTDLQEITPPDALHIQRQIADLRGADSPMDTDNLITSLPGGFAVPVGSGLTKAVAAGTATIDGETVSYAGENKTFTARRDTYRDLADDGTMTFTAVLVAGDAPDLASGSLRIGRTTTDGSGVVDDTILAATLYDFGTPEEVPPE